MPAHIDHPASYYNKEVIGPKPIIVLPVIASILHFIKHNFLYYIIYYVRIFQFHTYTVIILYIYPTYVQCTY